MSKSIIKKEEISEKVFAVLAEVSPESASKAFGLDSLLIDDYHIDSLKVAELSFLLDERFDIALFLPDFFASVQDPHDLTAAALVAFVEKHLESQSGE